MSTYLVGEVGLNHMGSADYAEEYLRVLAETEMDAVTFQVREPAFYGKSDIEQALRLSEGFYSRVRELAHVCNLDFGIALCDIGKLGFFESVDTNFYKVLSKDINDTVLVDALLATGKPVYVSTGMSDEGGLIRLVGRTRSAPNLNLIHTQLSYDDADTNLLAIARMRELCGVPVAFGLHSRTVEVLYAALGFGPAALFVYVKGGRYAKHRDEEHALSLGQCGSVASTIRRLEAMMGSGIKKKMENRIP